MDARGRLLAELADVPARKGYSIAYDLLGNRAEAEEAVQEALASACESIADLRDPAAAPGWFLRIVTTTCLRTLRRRRLKKRLFGWWPGAENEDRKRAQKQPVMASGSQPMTALGNTASVSADTGADDIAGRMHALETVSPPDALAGNEALTAMLDRLEQLSAQQRTALVLRYGHDLPVGEIAALLGVELATAKTHLVRGLARLRDLMEEHR